MLIFDISQISETISFKETRFKVSMPLLLPEGSMVYVAVKTSEDTKTAEVYDECQAAFYSIQANIPAEILLSSAKWSAEHNGIEQMDGSVFTENVPAEKLKGAIITVGNAIKETIDLMSWKMEQSDQKTD